MKRADFESCCNDAAVSIHTHTIVWGDNLVVESQSEIRCLRCNKLLRKMREGGCRVTVGTLPVGAADS
jgi:hypothetical protein